MNRDEKIEFVRIYFGSENIHTDFDILEKAHEILPTLPDEIDSIHLALLIKILLTKRGLISNIKYLEPDRFQVILESFFSLFPVSLISFLASHNSFVHKVPYLDGWAKSAVTAGYTELSQPQTVMTQLTDFLFLFGASSKESAHNIMNFSGTSESIKKFHISLDCLLLEKKYVSVKNFKLIHMNTFAAQPHILDAARRSLRFLNNFLFPPNSKFYLYLLTLLLLDGSDDSIQTVRSSAVPLSRSDDTIHTQTESLLRLLKKAGISDSFEKIYTLTGDSNV